MAFTLVYNLELEYHLSSVYETCNARAAINSPIKSSILQKNTR